MSTFKACVTAMELLCKGVCNCNSGDSQQWEMCVNLNLTAPMLLTQAFAAGMEKKKVRIQAMDFISANCKDAFETKSVGID